MTGELRLGNVVVVEELRSADSRPRVGAFTITDAVVREVSVADWVEVGRQLGAETVWLCHYAELNDPDCYSGHPNAKPEATRQPRKHTQCGWHLVLPVESPTPKEE